MDLKEVEELAEKIYPHIVNKQDEQKADKDLMAWRAFGYAGTFLQVRDAIREGTHRTAVQFHSVYLK